MHGLSSWRVRLPHGLGRIPALDHAGVLALLAGCSDAASPSVAPVHAREGLPLAAIAAATAWPLKDNVLTQDYGAWNDVGADAPGYHAGLDLAGVEGATRVYAIADGQVHRIFRIRPGTEDNHCLGNVVILHHPAQGVYSLYAHLDAPDAKLSAGTPVVAGKTVVGTVGRTGFNKQARVDKCQRSAGAHLHLEVKLSGVLHNPLLPDGGPAPDEGLCTSDLLCAWSYTPPKDLRGSPSASHHPTQLGYRDPIGLLHALAPRATLLEVVQPAKLRYGPGTLPHRQAYPSFATLASGTRLRAMAFVAGATDDPVRCGTATTNGVPGWYQVMSLDEEGFWFDAKPAAKLDDGWICSDLIQESLAPPPELTAPSPLVATAAGNAAITLTWTDRNSDEWGYQIERSPGGAASFALVASTGPNVETYEDGGLSAATSYTYRVRAIGQPPRTSGYSNEATATTAAPTLAAPSQLVAVATGLGAASGTAIQIHWTDNALGESGYEVERAPGGTTDFAPVPGAQTGGPPGTGEVLLVEDSQLAANTAYVYRVRAWGPAGAVSDYSNLATATTFPQATWTPVSPFSTGQGYGDIPVVTLGSALMTFGGGGFNFSGATFWTDRALYDPALDTWTSFVGWPCSLGGGTCLAGSAAVAHNGLVFLLGGYTFWGPVPTVRTYNPSLDQWGSVADLPVASRRPVAGVLAGQIHVATCSPTGAPGLYRYEAGANTWTTLTPPPHPHCRGAGDVLEGKLYLVGGDDAAGAVTRQLDIFDPATGGWTAGAPHPIPLYDHAAVAAGSSLVVAGGSLPPDAVWFPGYVDRYLPALDVWRPMPALTLPRNRLALGWVGGTLYAIGGVPPLGAFPTTTVEAFPLP